MIKHKIKQLCYCLFLMFLFEAIDVRAATIDITKEATITINYRYDELALQDASISLYKVADISEGGVLTFLDDFISVAPTDPDSLTSSQWSDLAAQLAQEVKNKNIAYDQSQTSDQFGKVVFEQVPVGLYLVTMDAITIGTYEYDAAPFVIQVPTYNEIENYFMYDITSVAKTDAHLIPEEPEEPLPSPDTSDKVVGYIGLFILSFVGIIIISIIVIKYQKKRSKK